MMRVGSGAPWQACGAISCPEWSHSSSPTSRARPDCLRSWGRRHTPRRLPNTVAGCERPSLATPGSRLTHGGVGPGLAWYARLYGVSAHLHPMPPSNDPSHPRTSDCCGPAPDPRIARHFDRKMEERAAAGELPSLHPVSQRVLDALSDIAEGRPSVLELGCGSGDLTVSLLERGAARVSGVDLSLASIEIA